MVTREIMQRLCLERETKRLDEKIVVLEDELESMTQELEVVKEKSTAFCDSSKEKVSHKFWPLLLMSHVRSE